MNENQIAAYVMAQAAAAMIEAMAMKAMNEERAGRGLAQAYGEEAFAGLIDKYQLGHNDVLTTLRGVHG